MLTLPGGALMFDTSVKAISNTGKHYDYVGYQIEWTKESKAFNYSHTKVNGTVNNKERWSRRRNNFFSKYGCGILSVELYTDAVATSSTKLTVHSITPILRPYEVSLAPSEPLKFLNENGEYVDNTKIARLKNANDTILQNASTNGKGTAVKFGGDYITVTTNSPYSYISGLEMINPKTGDTRPILSGLKPGTTSASVQRTNDFMMSYVKYINFADNGDMGDKGQFQVRAVLDYYDVGVNIHEDPNASVTMTKIERPPTGDMYITPGEYYIKSSSSGKYIRLNTNYNAYPNDVSMNASSGTKFNIIPAFEYRGGTKENSVVIAVAGQNDYGLSTSRRPGDFGPQLCHGTKLGISCLGAQNMFTITRQDDDTYVINDFGLHAISESGSEVSYEWSYHPERLSDKTRWIFEPANGEYKKTTWSLHRGDTVKFTQKIENGQYKSSRIRFVTREMSTAEEIDVRRAYDKGSADTCTMFCDYSSIDVYPSYEQSMRVIVRIKKNDINIFQKDKGIFTCPSVENGDYIDYIVTNENDFAESVYYEYSAYSRIDGYVPVWDNVYTQSTYYFQSSNVPERNVITLTAKPVDRQKYVLTGAARYSDTSINGTAEGSAWMPAKGAYVLMGSSVYGISDDDGNLTTIGAPGISGYRFIYKTVASGTTRYATARLRNSNTVEYSENTYDPVTGDVAGTLAQSNTQQPVTQDINPQTNLSFINLPLIGELNTSFNVSFISLSISQLPNGGERLSFGVSPTPLALGNTIKNVETGVDYGLKDIHQAFSETKEFGEAVNIFGKPFGGSHYAGMKAFSIRPIFGLYLDFGLKSLSVGSGTKTTMSFMGGGLYLGGSAQFRGTIYFTIGWLPMYFGTDGELTIYTQVGVSTINKAEDVTADMVMSESNTFEKYFEPTWCLQANVVVAVYAGVGLCGTLGVRGGFQLDMNFMYNHTIQKLYPNVRKLGAVLDFKLKVWVDALIFSIPVPVANLANKRYGYYEDLANSEAEGGIDPKSTGSDTELASADEDTKIIMRPRSENQSDWLPNGDISLASTFEEASSTVLLENGYDRADPQLMDLGGGRILLAFIADDPERGDSDRTALMYSVCKNGTWSEPVKIQDDGTADFEPDLCDAGDKVLITWTSRSPESSAASETDYIFDQIRRQR